MILQHKFRRKTIWLFLLSVLLILSILFLFFIPGKKKEWTRQNSLNSSHLKILKDNLPGDHLSQALSHSIEYFNRIPPTREFFFGEDVYTTDKMLESLIDFQTQLEEQSLSPDFFEFITSNYRFYRSSVGKKVLFTGYYEALLSGSLERTDEYSYPLYKRPKDLIKIDLTQFYFYRRGMPRIIRGRLLNSEIIPYYNRNDIDVSNILIESDLNLVWLNDPVERFFLQIQGSGIISLTNGEKMRVNYDGSNGHPYRSIGKFLLDRGNINRDDVSMQSIKKYLNDHPEEMDEVFNFNPSYVFFRSVEAGPMGALGVPVLPFRSIATDSSLFPRGALCYISTEIPIFNQKDERIGFKKISGFVLNQDTGGAIKSPSRVDLFTGNGKASLLIAGHLKNHGELYFLIKK